MGAIGGVSAKSECGISSELRKPDTSLALTLHFVSRAMTPGTLVAAGITITHPERVISASGHITKGELAEYYAAVASFMLPGIVRRPLSLLRCPARIDAE